MLLPKKVSRKLTKTNKNVKKNKKTGKKLKGGSGRGKSGNSRRLLFLDRCARKNNATRRGNSCT